MTDFRALCAELLEIAELYSDGGPDYEPFEQILARARAALAQPEPKEPSGPPPRRWRSSEPDEQFIRMDEGRIQCSTGNNPTTPKPKIIPRGQVSGSGVVRVKGTFEHGGRTYNYEADAKPTGQED